VLTAGTEVYLRTRRHPAVAGLPSHLHLRDFDDVYESGDDFDSIYARIAAAVIAAAQDAAQDAPGRDVIYAVPGHPLVGEASVPLILERARVLGLPTRIVSGLSFIEPSLEALSSQLSVLKLNTRNSELGTENSTVDPLAGLFICDALELAAMHHPPINPDRPALVAQVYSRAVAGDVKLTLMNQYPPDHEVWIVRAGSRSAMNAGRGRTAHASPSMFGLPLHEFDHHDAFDHLTSLYVPALSNVGGFEAFQETVAHLRAPEGCPWDREQTHESLRTTLLEEAYEVLTAIDEGDVDALAEELGDLLLNIVLQVQIATEAEEFRMSDVIASIDAKLKRRHPHVFGDLVLKDAAQVLANWGEIKRQEQAAKGRNEASVLDGIAPALPALAQAQKLAHRAERAGFKWDSHTDRLNKVREEIGEIVGARDEVHRAEEFGDLLFTIADWADGYGIDAETVAREANLKFERRFRALERVARERGLALDRLSQTDMLAIWREIKERESARP
jgi:tetrapyrrole methylase family protein/MazG family protein